MLSKLVHEDIERIVDQLETLEKMDYRTSVRFCSPEQDYHHFYKIIVSYPDNIRTFYHLYDVIAFLQQLINERSSIPHLDWSKAPDWAMYWAVDANRSCYWYKTRPGIGIDMWRSGEYQHDKTLNKLDVDWAETLQERPTP